MTTTSRTEHEERFSHGDRMLDPAEAPTEIYLRQRTYIDPATGRLCVPGAGS